MFLTGDCSSFSEKRVLSKRNKEPIYCFWQSDSFVGSKMTALRSHVSRLSSSFPCQWSGGQAGNRSLSKEALTTWSLMYRSQKSCTDRSASVYPGCLKAMNGY